MTNSNMIFGLHSQTSIHAGAGSSTSVIDLPIQREGHTGWPCVFGSAIKGALRAHAEVAQTDDAQAETRKVNDIKVLFGPDTQSGADHAGALLVGDARLLLLPVRSLTTQFKWVCCPAVLQQFSVQSQRFGATPLQLDEVIHQVAKQQAVVPEQSHEGTIYLEEYRFESIKRNLDHLTKRLAALMYDSEFAATALSKQLVIINDDMFSHIATHATPVNAHIALDSKTKTVTKGALWYEETLPPDTLLYTGISARDSRVPNKIKSDDIDTSDSEQLVKAADIAEKLRGLFSPQPWLQIGGNETVGMGWVSVNEGGS